MKKHRFISEEEMQEAQKEKLVFAPKRRIIRAPHFVEYVLSKLEGQFESSDIVTTLDYHLQEKIHEIARRHIQFLAGRNIGNAAVFVLDPKSSEILAMLGSLDYFDETIDGQVNMALRPRQPGSAMKPITYGVSFEHGWNGATLVTDEPVRFFTAEGNPYLPKNYDYEYHGKLTVREALANSYNIPAVKAIDFVGVDAVLQKAREMGLSTLKASSEHYGLALTLGDGEVKLKDLVSAYAVFANGGVKKIPQAILEIKNKNGTVHRQKNAARNNERVLSEEVSFMITDILSDNAARLAEFGLANILELDRKAAVKTGTTRNFRDNWTIGYTPDYVVGVWVGNSDNTPMYRVSGVYGAGPIWHDVMEELHRGKEKKWFSIPAGLEQREVCIFMNEDGKYCEKKVMEWMIKKSSEKEKKVYINTIENSEKKPPLRIKKPFDLDVFQIAPGIDQEVQKIKFQSEKAKDLAEVTWFVNGEEIGKGDEIFWQLREGNFVIKAKSGDVESEDIRITIF